MDRLFVLGKFHKTFKKQHESLCGFTVYYSLVPSPLAQADSGISCGGRPAGDLIANVIALESATRALPHRFPVAMKRLSVNWTTANWLDSLVHYS